MDDHGGPIAHLINGDHMQRCIVASEQKMRPYRLQGLDHVQYFCGRWYGNASPMPATPLNLVAQSVRAYIPKLVPASISHDFKPLKYGLDIEAMTLKKLLERDDEKQSIIDNVYEHMIAEHFFFPMSVSYTGLKPGDREIQIAGQMVNPGDPFVIHVPFQTWLVDPFAQDLRSRQWEAHSFRASRDWLLESPAYANARDIIANLPAWEDNPQGRLMMQDITGNQPIGGRASALFDTIELYNVVVYDHGRIFEGTICPQQTGPGIWLRGEEWIGPDQGPYDHLYSQTVPGMLIPLALLALTRDISEAGDTIARKLVESAKQSKINYGYKRGAQTDADSLRKAAHGDMIEMEDPEAVAKFETNLVSRDLVGMMEYVQNAWNEASGNAQLLRGSGPSSETATEADLRNSRASEQIGYMQTRVERLIRSHSRKRAWYFMTDPLANFTVPITSRDGRVIELAYSAANREGKPDDYVIRSEATPVAMGSPELRAKRIIDGMAIIGQNLPLFQMGIFSLPRTLKFFNQNIAEGFEDLSEDPQMMQDRLLAEQMAERYNNPAASGGQPGTPQTAAEDAGKTGGKLATDTLAAQMQLMMQQAMQQMGRPPAQPGGPGGVSPPVTGMNGLRQQARAS